MPRRRVRTESVALGVRISKQYLIEIERLIKEGYYLDISDYVRDVIRKDFEKRGFKPTGEVEHG